MRKINIIKKLGFDPNLIEDKDLKREFISIVKYFLNDYYMDETIKTRELYLTIDGQIVVDGNKTYKFCRGFYKKLSYDFICIHDSKNDTYELIIEPTFKSKFSDVNFSESMSIKYDLNSQELSVDRLTTDSLENLVEEKYSYAKSSQNKSLILFSEIKRYSRFYVSILEEKYNNKARKFYSKGKYSLRHLVEPFEDKIFTTTKNENAFHLLKVNGIDADIFVCGGTTMYSYDKQILDDFQILSNEINVRKPLFINHIQNCQTYPIKEGLLKKVKVKH